MIKYEIKTGCSFLNEKARQQRDIGFKPKLKGMRCGKCSEHTVIKFVETDFTHVKAVFNSCCSEFENRIKDKLWNKN
ncbi:hypothetical protein ABMY20_15285 [Tenacibaculum sp. SSH1-16]|uniref:hypothetical protein n=1 Tax=Tenacibaculum sp. SSH1-16 TaxID=3136667 RepID=UPI0032C4A420